MTHRTRRLGPRRARSDEGAYAIIFAVVLSLFVILVSYVINIAAMREDRRADRLATDAAVTAAVSNLSDLPDAVRNPQKACEDAWSYLQQNLQGSFSAADTAAGVTACQAKFQASVATCPSSDSGTNADKTASWNAGPYTIKVTWPVVKSESVMTHPDIAPGNIAQNYNQATDGTDPCARLAVQVSRSRGFIFSSGHPMTVASSVALWTRTEKPGNPSIPLVVLDPKACDAVDLPGGAKVVVKASSDGAVAGRIAVDSAGNGSCKPTSNPVIDANLPGELYALDGTSDVAEIWSYALQAGNTTSPWSSGNACPPGVHSSDTASYTSYGSAICPRPHAHDRETRATFDNAFGCIDSASSPCTHPDSTNYIKQYLDFVKAGLSAGSPPGGYQVIKGSDCTQDPKSGPPVYLPGNYWVDCPNFEIKSGTVAFGPGNDIFLGDVTNKACLAFNFVPPSTDASDIQSTASADCNYDPATATPPGPPAEIPTQSTVYAAGTVSVNGPSSGTGGQFWAPQTFLFLHSVAGSKTSDPAILQLQPNNLTWTAPYDDSTVTDWDAATKTSCVAGDLSKPPTAGCFNKLALWNDADTKDTPQNSADNIQGSSSAGLQGAFFMPNARTYLNGSNTGNVTSAQFYTGRLTVNGSNSLTLQSDPNRQLPSYGSSIALIR